MKKFSKVKDYFKNHPFISVLLFILFMFACILLEMLYIEETEPQEVSYLEFRDDLETAKIDTIYYTATEEMMRYTLLNEETLSMTKEEREKYDYGKEYWRMTKFPASEDFRKEILEYDVNLVVKSFEPITITLFSSLVTILAPFIFFIYVIKLMSTTGVGSLNTRNLIKETNVKFSDVIGHDEVIKDLEFIVELLKNPSKGEKLGAEPPRGILFSGEPGTGKTLLAKAIAGESGVPFIYMNASSFIELYVGTGAKRVRELFKLAKSNSPCIIFIDEIDAVGRKRDRFGSNSEDHQTIDALLQEMDGFDGRSGIFVIAATNNADSLDKALVRSGRFDRQVIVSAPKDWKVRLDLFNHYLENTPVSESLNLTNISKQTSGFTGADINAVVNEAKLIATMRDSDVIETSDIEEAIDKKIFKGNRSKKEQYKKDKELVAYHEAGHAVVTYLLGYPIARVSIIGSTSGVGGFVMRSEQKSQFRSKQDLENQIMISYGGRCSEEIKFSDVTTGASSDITQSTDLIRAYILKYGFLKNFGMLDVEVLNKDNIVSGEMVLSLMSELSTSLEKKTLDLLKSNYELVEILADKLLILETISGDEVKEILAKKRG